MLCLFLFCCRNRLFLGDIACDHYQWLVFHILVSNPTIAEMNTYISGPVKYLLKGAFFSAGSFGYFWKNSACFTLETTLMLIMIYMWIVQTTGNQRESERETERERERGKFYYVLGEESLNVYSLGTDTAKVFLLLLGRAHIPVPPPTPIYSVGVKITLFLHLLGFFPSA